MIDDGLCRDSGGSSDNIVWRQTLFLSAADQVVGQAISKDFTSGAGVNNTPKRALTSLEDQEKNISFSGNRPQVLDRLCLVDPSRHPYRIPSRHEYSVVRPRQ